MDTNEPHKMVKLRDTDETVAMDDEDIRGYSVKDRNGEDIGKIDDLLVDAAENKVRFIEVASGGFLGIGKDRTSIPVDAITKITRDIQHGHGEVWIDQTKEGVAGAPPYDPDLVHNRSAHEEMYEYYGLGPYWEDSYTYPRYPYYE